jgi:hypothetical protein
MAADIQKNVDTLFANPSDQQALDALHQESQQLNGNLVGGQRTRNAALQDSVQAELKKLEASGHLPTVSITLNGQIYSEIANPWPPGTGPMNTPRGAPGPGGRDVFASPDQPTKVLNF